MTFSQKLGVLTCVPRIALETEIAAGTMCALNVPDLKLAALQISFVTLVENETLPGLSALEGALAEAAANWEAVSGVNPILLNPVELDRN